MRSWSVLGPVLRRGRGMMVSFALMCWVMACHPHSQAPQAAVTTPVGSSVAGPQNALPQAPVGSSKEGMPKEAMMVHGQHDHGPRPSGIEDVKLGIRDGSQAPVSGTRVICPVCGDEFTVSEGSPVRHYKGKSLVFCCERCLPHFEKNKEMILNQ